MRNLLCRCGYRFKLSSIPVVGEHDYFAEAEWDELVAALTRAALNAGGDRTATREAISDTLAVHVRQFFQCPSCGRHVFWSADGDRTTTSYRVEDDTSAEA